MANDPVVAIGTVLTPNELEEVPPAVRVTGEIIERLAPAGAVPTQRGDRVTEELKPFREAKVIGTAMF